MFMAFQFEPSVIVSTMPMLMRGVWYTIYLTIGGLFFGFILGVAAGLMKLSKRFTATSFRPSLKFQ